MEHKIINTGDYLLIVDESEIKDGEWVYVIDENFLARYFYNLNSNYKKVISHLPVNNSPILEGVDLLPPMPYEPQEAFEEANKNNTAGIFGTKNNPNADIFFKQGYKKAKEKYKYTEEDLMKAIDMTREYTPDVVGFTKDEIIQSLNQPKMPVKFVCEMKKDYRKNDDGEPIGLPVHETYKPKTTTNSQGIIQWVGEYIY
jgi:hypothetical protein